MTTVAIAEDDPDIRALVTFKLELAGYTVLAAADGPSALAAITRERPDVAIVDIRMPGLSGLDVCRELRADPATATLPVILLSAGALESDVRDGLMAGADDYMVKPFSRRDLVNRVEALLTGGRGIPLLNPSMLADVATRAAIGSHRSRSATGADRRQPDIAATG